MSNVKKQVSLVAAIREYFGFLPGQKLADFMQELKALSPEEKKELGEGAARELGYEIASKTSAHSS